MKLLKCTDEEINNFKIEKNLKLSWEMSPNPYKIELGGEIVALISISKGGEYGPNSIEIDNFEVFNKDRGTGSIIIRKILSQTKNQTVSLYPDNKRCINFWLSHGFKMENEGGGVIRLIFP